MTLFSVVSVKPLVGGLAGEVSVQREHEVDEIEAEDELEAVRGQGEGKCTEIHPDDIVHQSVEED